MGNDTEVTLNNESSEFAEIDLSTVRRVFIETKEFGEISIREDARGVHIVSQDSSILIAPKSDDSLILQNANRIEKDK